MLGQSDRPIEEVIRALAASGVEAGYLVPTETGLAKSIMDAHGQLRDYLRRKRLHDYDAQGQGRDAKVVVAAWHVTPDGLEPAKASLYRPETKTGDPRIWVTGLPRQARPRNLLALLVHEGALYVANMSNHGMLESIGDPTSPIGRLVRTISDSRRLPADRLLRKLRDIGAKGYVKSLRAGPTGVGMTLETLLGIEANSSKLPDYDGIEIKASRTFGAGKRQNRITLFSRVPDWRKSAVPNAVSLLQKYGYDVDGRRQLYCSLNHMPNTLGLFLGPEGDYLHAMHGRPGAASKVVQWGFDGLKNSLAEKHQETFWVKATARRASCGTEEFHYVQAVHTRAPMVSNLCSLFELGRIELDFLLHLLDRAPGKRPRARDHGYLFKMDPDSIGLLFPPSIRYELR